MGEEYEKSAIDYLLDLLSGLCQASKSVSWLTSAWEKRAAGQLNASFITRYEPSSLPQNIRWQKRGYVTECSYRTVSSSPFHPQPFTLWSSHSLLPHFPSLSLFSHLTFLYPHHLHSTIYWISCFDLCSYNGIISKSTLYWMSVYSWHVNIFMVTRKMTS